MNADTERYSGEAKLDKLDVHVEEDVAIDPVAERRLLWKMDLHLVVSRPVHTRLTQAHPLDHVDVQQPRPLEHR